MINKLRTLLLLCIGLFLNQFSFAQVNSDSNNKPKLSSKSFERTVNAMIKESVPLMRVQELKANQDKYVLLDAREVNEYQVSHIEKALYIGYDQWDDTVLSDLDKDAPIVVYCSIGVRSEDIGEKLQERGFTNVHNLYGSIFEWANQGYPLVDNAGYPTMKIHGFSWLWGKWMTNEHFEKVYE